MSGRKKMEPVRIVRVVKRRPHGAGHGGSWKVAYADFVTAMMAFFLVMWVVGMESEVKDLIQGYFNNPVGFKKAYSTGSSPIGTGATPIRTALENVRWVRVDAERRRLEALAQRLQSRLREDQSLADVGGLVEVLVGPEGLRIELVEAGGGETFFARGSAVLKPGARRALALIAQELAAVPNPVAIEGHTDAAPYGAPGYSNWELSVDRANAARHALEVHGLDARRIAEVRGYADRRPRVPDRPLDPSNRRITILLPYAEPPGGPPAPSAPGRAGG